MSELDIALRDLQEGVTLARLESLAEELVPLNFDTQNHTDDRYWWRDQDADMQRAEMESLERQADIEDMRLNGYA